MRFSSWRILAADDDFPGKSYVFRNDGWAAAVLLMLIEKYLSLIKHTFNTQTTGWGGTIQAPHQFIYPFRHTTVSNLIFQK